MAGFFFNDDEKNRPVLPSTLMSLERRGPGPVRCRYAVDTTPSRPALVPGRASVRGGGRGAPRALRDGAGSSGLRAAAEAPRGHGDGAVPAAGPPGGRRGRRL